MNCIFYAIFEGYVPDLHDYMLATFRIYEAHFFIGYKMDVQLPNCKKYTVQLSCLVDVRFSVLEMNDPRNNLQVSV
jgi:hypothetical protein